MTPGWLYIVLRCRACCFLWHAATVDPHAWWASPNSGADAAKQCYCPSCGDRPPQDVMEIR